MLLEIVPKYIETGLMIAVGALCAPMGPSASAMGEPASVTPAGTVQEAKATFDQGRREYNLGHYAEALALFEHVYKVKPLNGLLFNIAQCHRMLGSLEAARRVYAAFIRESGDNEPNLDSAKDKLAEVEGALKAQAAAKISAPTGLAQERPLPPILAGALDAASGPSGGQAAPRQAKTAAAPITATAVEAPPRAPAVAGTQRGYLSLTLIGAGIVAAGAGGLFAFQAKGAVQDWHDATTSAQWNDSTSRVQSNTTMANTGFIAGAVLATVGVALLIGTSTW